MHEQGLIGYFAGRNGVGLRIFFNRAASSIGVRPGQSREQILAFPPASSGAARASTNEAAFNDSFAVREMLDTDLNPVAPKDGAAGTPSAVRSPADPTPQTALTQPPRVPVKAVLPQPPHLVAMQEVVSRLRAELEPALHAAARQAAAREHERTRQWFEHKGLPRAARVAQHEAFNVLRQYGLVSAPARPSRAHANVGRGSYVPPAPRPLSEAEAGDLAQACVAMLETQGRSIEATLCEMSAEAGGFLLPPDVCRVREKANSLVSAGEGGKGN
jgi:hypothetical protein